MNEISRKCTGSKDGKQCTRSVVVDSSMNEDSVLCWEHQDLLLHKLAEKRPAKTFFVQVKKKTSKTLSDLAKDEENVHTPEINSLLIKSIENLKNWANEKKIKVQYNLTDTIQTYLLSNQGREWRGHPNVQGALNHLRECYNIKDDMALLGVTYPQLSSWVWSRITSTEDEDKKRLLLERFFEEVFESTKLCLNGNMARLINVFACIDDEINPQDGSKVYTPEILQGSIYNVIQNVNFEIDEMIHEIRTILYDAKVPLDLWADWIDEAISERLNL